MREVKTRYALTGTAEGPDKQSESSLTRWKQHVTHRCSGQSWQANSQTGRTRHQPTEEAVTRVLNVRSVYSWQCRDSDPTAPEMMSVDSTTLSRRSELVGKRADESSEQSRNPPNSLSTQTARPQLSLVDGVPYLVGVGVDRIDCPLLARDVDNILDS